MAKKQKGNVPYRNIHPKIWADADVKELSDAQFRFFIFAFSAPMSSDNSNFGIFEVDTGAIGMFCRIDTATAEGKKKLDEIIDFFNHKKPRMIEYDRENHILFCKKFTKYQSDYLSTWQGYIPKLLHDWEETKEKVPHFWKEFYKRNKARILKMNKDAKTDKKNDIGLSLDEFIFANSEPLGSANIAFEENVCMAA